MALVITRLVHVARLKESLTLGGELAFVARELLIVLGNMAWLLWME